ncbi:MAG TPA: lipoyl(octanoyl) transferase LipB [Dehalococcoidia bacterium]|nr:lipoyl(octanoyl) transferase LipB [Dehalococcoidia bacterium]
MSDILRLVRFGTLPYDAAWRWQRDTAAGVRKGAPEALALLQHPPTYTFGRRVRPEHLLVDAGTLRARGATLVESDRGGDVTFHGPGQVVCYPILNLRRYSLGAADYVRLLERTMIGALRRFGVEAGVVHGRPGVWLGGAKIGAIGVRIEGGVTTHGFALNVDTDLAWYDAIVPCGIAGAAVTSLAQVGVAVSIEAVEDALLEGFATLLDVAFDGADRSCQTALLYSQGEGPGERLSQASSEQPSVSLSRA